MLKPLFAILLLLVPQVVRAEDPLTQYQWQARVMVVFAGTREDPRFVEQMDLLGTDPEALAEREVVVLTDTDPALKSALRQRFRPRGFEWVLIGKEGAVKLRKPFPWDLRALGRAIDKWPLRREEMRRARALR